MKKLASFKQWIVLHVAAYVLFIGIVFSFFSPIFFQHKKLFQGDIPHHEGIAKQLIDYRKQTGQEPLWTNAVFSGMPAYLIDVHYQEPFTTSIKKLISGFMPSNVGYIFAALLACYLLLLSLGINPYVAMAGGVGYGLSTFTLISIAVGHDGKVAAMAYMPLVLAGVHLAYHKNRWWGGLLTMLGLSLQISATHPQITYYLGVVLVIYGLNQLIVDIRHKQLRPFMHTSGVLLLAAAMAVAANFGRLWNIYEYGKYSIRGGSELASSNNQPSTGVDKEYAFMWSLGKLETMTLLIPNFYGGSSHEQLGKNSEVAQVLQRQSFSRQQIQSFLQYVPTYRGEQPFTEGPMYLGAIICFLCLVGLWVVNKQQRHWLLASIVFSILLAWGKNYAAFNDIMYYYLPGYNKFRAVTTSIVIAQLATVMLACLALQYLIKQGITPHAQKGLCYSWCILGTVLLISIFLASYIDYTAPQDSSLPGWLAQALQVDRKHMLQYDAVRSLAFILAVSLLIGAYWKKRISAKQLTISLVVLIVLDFYGVGKRYVRVSSYRTQAEIEAQEFTPARQHILQDTTLGYRVFNVSRPFTDGRTSYYHQSVGGYHGAKLRRYQGLIEYGLSKECYQVSSYLQGQLEDWVNLPLLNMLNTRYFVYSSDGVITNPYAFGNAWFVQEIYPVDSPLAEIEALQQADLQQVAVIDTTQFSYPVTSTVLGGGQIDLLVYQPNYLQYEANALADGLVVFSEIYYEKGWQAWIDDNPVKPIRANYVLRALPIPAGKHIVTFQFKPYSYIVGNRFMLIFNIILLALLILIGGCKILQFSKSKRSDNI